MIRYSTLSKTKNKILLTCLHGNWRDSLGEFNVMSHVVFAYTMYSVMVQYRSMIIIIIIVIL